jgi:hypothetical protein
MLTCRAKHLRTACLLLMAVGLSSCALSHYTTNIRPKDIRQRRDSIIIGRLTFDMKMCLAEGRFEVIGKDSLKIYNCTDNSKHLLSRLGLHSRTVYGNSNVRGTFKPIAWNVTPGEYILSYLLGKDEFPLTTFTVPQGTLVYFGHLTIEVECTWGNRTGNVRHGSLVVNKTSVSNEFAVDRAIFQQGFPEVYEAYKNNVINAVKE